MGGNTTDALIVVTQMSSLRGDCVAIAVQPYSLDGTIGATQERKRGERRQDRGVADKNANVGFSY